jgi:predicted ATPase
LYADTDEIYHLLPIKYRTITYQNVHEARIRTRYAYENFPGLKSIKFSGIRGFADLQSINFEGRNSLLLIGENGVGKSTLLELIKRAVKPHTKLILSDLITTENAQANMRVEYNDVTARELIFSDEEGYTQGKKHQCNVIEISELRILNSQIKKLVSWISMIHDEGRNSLNNSLFSWVERQLKILLSLPQESSLQVENGNVFWLRDNNSNTREYLEYFSSGYKSIMTMFYFIVSKFIKSNHDNAYTALKEGLSNSIVLIDEIELHLHPVFKKEIIEKLQQVFPEILFIMTTHDPLVLKSAGPKTKVILLSKNDNKTFIDEELPDPQYMSTGQILTSPIFGLSTIEFSHETQANLDSYYKALGKRNWSEVDFLREKLADSGLFGQTYRELIALSAVDAYLVKKEIPKIDSIINILENSDA